MSDLLQNEILKQVNELLLLAEEEERKYNWKNEIEILKKIERISLDNKLKDIEGDVYFKLGELYVAVAEFERSEENILNNIQLAISSFRKAYEVFKDLKSKREEKISASLGVIDYLEYLYGFREGKEEILLESAKKCFNKSRLINFEKGNLIDSLEMAILEYKVLNLFIAEKCIRMDENIDLTNLILEFEKLNEQIWEELEKGYEISEYYIWYFLESSAEFSIWSVSYLSVENPIKKYEDKLNRFKKFIDTFEKSSKKGSLLIAYSILSMLNMQLSAFIVDNQFEQKKYLKIAQTWIRKGEILFPKFQISEEIVLFYFMRFAIAIFLIYLGYFAKDFKHALENLNRMVDSIHLYVPKITAATVMFFAVQIFLIAALNHSIPDMQRIDFAKKALDLIELMTIKIPIVNNPNYKIYYLTKDFYLCTAHAILGDLIKDRGESSNHLQISSKIFNTISNIDTRKINNTYIYLFYLSFISRTGILLAENTSNKSEKINYYQKTMDFLLRSKAIVFAIFYIENLFFIGDIYFELGRLMNDDKLFKKSSISYTDAINYCKNKGYYNLLGSGYINLAKIEDRLGNFTSAADNYKKVVESFDQAIMTLTYTKLSKKIEKLRNYMEAWNLIEIAKSYHINEDHQNAQLHYEQASQILSNLHEYKFESPFYSGWAILEKAEYLSKKNRHQDAQETYLVAKNNFQDAIKTFNSYLKKKKAPEDIDRIRKLIQVAQIRERYCTARHQIETARLESKKGNHLNAAELYNKAGSLFENLCQLFKIEREREELIAIFYLCKAWENMERADFEQESSLYAVASELFKKAGNTFYESKMKKLSLGNSLYCSALEYGSLFDNSTELEEKTNYYKKIKVFLRESSKNYKLGGFENDAQWALATSTFFDGIWHLIQSDNEIDHSKKRQYLSIATNYLSNALDIFGKAGYKQRREEILKYIKMIKDEKAILTSALNLIEKPAISASSVGISAPSCPIEISSSVNIDEMQRTDLQTESEINWHKRIHHIYLFMPNGTCIYDHPFKLEKEIEPQLVAGGLTGISMLIQEMTQEKTKIKIVEQEDMTILLEHGKYLSTALITEENLITLRNKLAKLIQEVEDFYQEELENYSGNISIFSKAGKFIQRIFEN